MRLLGDMMEWCTRNMPRWHPVSISGYHIREAGATAAQELAFTLKDGFTYVEQQMARGIDVDDFAPRLSFFFNAQIDFFEEIAKYRAARRIWAREMKETYGAKNPRSWLMRFHTQTAGVSLTAQQPLNNIVRTAIEALAGVLGGTQSLHTNSYDEALALPTEDAVRIALRTQQIIAHETGVTNTVDPLGGSYFVEALTDRMEEQAYAYFAKIDELGGMVEAVKRNYPQREIADAAFELQEKIDDHEQVVVGVNRYTEGDDGETPILRIDPEMERKQIGRVQAVRARRDGAEVERKLAELRSAAATEANLMPVLIECAQAHATEGEMVDALQHVWGAYTESPVFWRLERFGVQLEEVADLVHPALGDELHVRRVLVVRLVGARGPRTPSSARIGSRSSALTSRMSSNASTPGMSASAAFARRKSASASEPSSCFKEKTTPWRIRPGVRVGIGRQSISRRGPIHGTSRDRPNRAARPRGSPAARQGRSAAPRRPDSRSPRGSRG